MARPKEFDIDVAVDAAIDLFRDHGFEGTSAQMLVGAMKIGRQSLYDTFGDKWGVYLAAVRRYNQMERAAHKEKLASGARAIEGLRAMFQRVAETASAGCLGVCSVVEFGMSKPDLVAARSESAAYLSNVLGDTIERGKAEGDIATDIDVAKAITYIISTITGMRVAARAGAPREHVASIAEFAIKGLA